MKCSLHSDHIIRDRRRSVCSSNRSSPCWFWCSSISLNFALPFVVYIFLISKLIAYQLIVLFNTCTLTHYYIHGKVKISEKVLSLRFLIIHFSRVPNMSSDPVCLRSWPIATAPIERVYALNGRFFILPRTSFS